MLRDAWFLARKDAWIMLRAKETILWTFFLPIVFFYFIGTVTSGFAPGNPGAKYKVALMDEGDGGFLLDQLEQRVADRDYEVVRIEDPEVFARYNRQLTTPAGFTGAVLAGTPMKIRFLRREGGLGADLDTLRISRAVYTLLADLIVTSEAGEDPSPEKFETLAAQPRLLTLDVSSAGTRIVPPSGFEQAVPGTMVMFTLIILLTSGTVLLLNERRQGLLRRLASSPLRRGSVVLGKWGARMILAGIQIAFAMTAGSVLFGVNWGPNLPALLLVMLAYAGLAATLSLLLGNIVRSEGQAIAIGVIASNILAALGGCWWPIEITPDWVQKLAIFLPTGITMDAMHKLVNFGRGAEEVFPHILALSAAALLVGWVVSRRFRFE